MLRLLARRFGKAVRHISAGAPLFRTVRAVFITRGFYADARNTDACHRQVSYGFMDTDIPRTLLGVAAVAMLAGCVAYQPESLPKAPDLKASVDGLVLPSKALRPIPGLRPRRIDPNAALSGTDVAILAVLNDPALRASETRRGVASAGVFAAGLLPDPILSLSGSRPTSGETTTRSGSSVGLSEALVPLLTRSARLRAAQANLRQVDLGLLWKGWQVAQHARWLAAEIIAERKLHRAEAAAYKLTRNWQRELGRIGVPGAASLDETAKLENLAGTLTSETTSTERRLSDAQHRLHALLGLEPSATLTLRPSPASAVGSSAIAAALKDLPQRRADLLALAAGFRSSDEKLRAAIAAQFPAISVSFLHQSDLEGVASVGIGLSLRLPFFNGNRGAIHKAEANRNVLRARYQARLDQAVSDVSRLQRDQVLLKRKVAKLQSMQQLLGTSWSRLTSLLNSGAASGIETMQATMHLYEIKRQQIETRLELRKTQIALETVLGVPADRLARITSGERP